MFARGEGRRGIGEGTPSGARDDVLLRSSGRGAEDRRDVSVGVGCVRVSSKTSSFSGGGVTAILVKGVFLVSGKESCNRTRAVLDGRSIPRHEFHFSLDAYHV